MSFWMDRILVWQSVKLRIDNAAPSDKMDILCEFSIGDIAKNPIDGTKIPVER